MDIIVRLDGCLSHNGCPSQYDCTKSIPNRDHSLRVHAIELIDALASEEEMETVERYADCKVLYKV